MSNNIGIITIHSVYNYGAMLQAFALSTYLKSKGYDVEIIDYRPYELCRYSQFYYRDLILSPRSALGKLKQLVLHRHKFDRFNKFLNEEMLISSTSYTSFESLKSHDYDILVTGSDQIWNPFITNWDESYLLTFDKKDAKKIAYSSSFGVSEIPHNWSEKVKSALIGFQKIGVREKAGKAIVERLLPAKHVEQVLDPVFLVDTKFWVNYSSDDLTPTFEYVLVYSLEVNDELIKYANLLADDEKIKIVTIHPYKANYDFANLCINDAGPKEFISLILNAKFVVTNSFHGIAFSIIFNKVFSCVLHSQTGTRMSSLLELIGLDCEELILKKTGLKLPIYSTDSKCRDELNKHIINSKNCLNFID